MDFNGIRALVMGKGVSGKGVADVLGKLGARVTVREGRTLPELAGKYDVVAVSPGLPPDHPIFGEASRLGIEIASDISIGAMLCTAPVIAVTGTNGKTTVVSMLGAIYDEAGIRAAVCGNIGRSFSECAYAGGYERAVLELSSFQLLHAGALRAHIACILNITPDHLDYHGSMSAYRAAKIRIADRQTSGDFLLVPGDLDISEARGSAEVLREGKDFYADGHLTVMGKRIMPVCDIAVQGAHNVSNALFAAAAAYADGVQEDAIARALSVFRTGAHRISEAGMCGGTVFYDDSKGTNPAATLAAARCMKGNTALIAGGSDKMCDFTDMFERMPRNVTAVFLTGDNAGKMADAARRVGGRAVIVCDTLRECVTLSGRGGYDSVLFSPASASFDRYADYAERGKAFEREIGRLVSGSVGQV